jgi:triphosphatase
VAHAIQNEAAAADGRQPEGVHQFRVALRQLRSAFSLFRTALPAGDVARWTEETRWLVGCLGRTRDLDVLTNELLAPLLAERPHDRGLQALREAALAKREAEQVAVREALASPRAGDLLFELAVWVELRGRRTAAGDEALREQRRPLRKRAVKILERCHRRVLKRGRGFAGLDAEGRHALRIAVKKLRYGIEFFETLFPAKRLQPYLAIVRRMQGQLGHLNDVVVAERLVRGLLAGPAAPGAAVVAALAGGELIGWHAHAVRTMEPAIVRAWDEFRTLEPFWRRGGRGR